MSDTHDPIKKLFETRLGNGRPPGPLDPELDKKWPELAVCLRVRTLDNNFVREPFIITIKVGLKQYRATIKDPTLQQTLDVDFPTLEGMWDAIEAKLVDPNAPWNEIKGRDPVGRKKKNFGG